MGRALLIVNDKAIPIDVQDGKPTDTKAVLVSAKGSSRTYVPLRFVTEAMGAKVKYERKTEYTILVLILGRNKGTKLSQQKEAWKFILSM